MPIYDCSPKGRSTEVTGVTSFNNRTGAVMPQAGDYTAAQVGAVAAAMAGQPNGVAELDGNGLVPASQLPGFVDDVVDAYIVGSTPYAADWLSLTSGGAALTPAASAIYLIVSAGEYQNRQYRWSGTQYAIISESLALGETADTAYRGDRGKTAYDHSQITDGNPHGTTGEDIPVSPGSEENIATALSNKAPAGFGFGDELVEIKAESEDESYETFCAKIDAFAADMPDNTAALVLAYPPAIYGMARLSLTVLAKGDNDYIALRNLAWGDVRGFSWQMIRARYPSSQSPSVWLPFEWSNPPLQIGVEYRTVERYQGKPVYVKVVNLGAGPDANTKKTVLHSIVDMSHIVDYGGEMYLSTGSSNPISLPGVSVASDETYSFGVNYSRFIWTAQATALTTYTGIGWVKYTKTTD